MKNSIYLLGILLLFSISCNENNKKSQPEETKTGITAKNDSINIAAPACLDVDTKIYKATEEMWRASWRFNHPHYTVDDSPQLRFTLDKLDSLQQKDPTAQGVRMYYVLPKKEEIIPSLAMVNMLDCLIPETCDEACILYSELGSVTEQIFITHKEFEEYKDNWASTYNPDDVSNIPVYAYNYSWETMMNAATENDNGIWVTYGLRTLGPLDTRFFVEDPSDTITGGIVYVNIVYENDPDPGEEFDETEPEQSEFDFAKPCPIYCD